MELYRRLAYSGWTASTVVMTDIPVNKAQLLGRMGDFDGGHTTAWMTGLTDPTWRAVRDARTGHSVHCISTRRFEALTADLRAGLRILNWMSIATPVVWYWWDHDWPRVLPAEEVPGRDHVNGGWAIPGVPEVHIYRREEAHKVLIHESIHALRLDIPIPIIEPVLSQFEGALSRKLWPHLGECFTEFYAEWLWSIASAKSLGDAGRRWNYQLTCSEKQAVFIWHKIRESTEMENTNVFAYYILKWVLMGHAAEVLLSPIASTSKWMEWWLVVREKLNKTHTETKKEFMLGMTCQ